MIARALGVFALVASVGLATPWVAPAPAGAAPAPVVVTSPEQRLHDAVEAATQRYVPGAAGSGWVLHGVERSEPGIDGREAVVATGVITTAGAPDTRVRLSGRYDPESGRLARVSYKLQPAARLAPAPSVDWSVQQAVQEAFGEVLPDEPVRFALESAQSSRVEGGGRRFDGAGIGTWGEDARYVAFTMTLSSRGELVEFDYSTQGEEDPAGYLATR